jgi:hypothetical protein
MNIAIPKEIVMAVLEDGGNNLRSGNMQPPVSATDNFKGSWWFHTGDRQPI